MPRSKPDGDEPVVDPFSESGDDDAHGRDAGDEDDRSRQVDARADAPVDPAACERRAVALLTRREHSRRELERKLAARGFAPGVVAATLDRLEQTGLLDGQRFMESFIESRASRGLGPLRIKAELIERGVPGGTAAEALASGRRDWAGLATAARAKRFGGAAPADFKERARQARFLEYRGFGHAEIRAALESRGDSD